MNPRWSHVADPVKGIAVLSNGTAEELDGLFTTQDDYYPKCTPVKVYKGTADW